MSLTHRVLARRGSSIYILFQAEVSSKVRLPGSAGSGNKTTASAGRKLQEEHCMFPARALGHRPTNSVGSHRSNNIIQWYAVLQFMCLCRHWQWSSMLLAYPVRYLLLRSMRTKYSGRRRQIYRRSHSPYAKPGVGHTLL